MPPELVKAHAHLDALVDRAYGLPPSCTDAERVAHLFALYAEAVKKEPAKICYNTRICGRRHHDIYDYRIC